MLLKSIKLVNFRQFINESIDFAEGKDGKNVTIILGENGTGKTTFAQAFFWCLYGDTEFSDKIMLNRKVANDMRPGQEEKVIVTLRLRHGEVEYTIVREQAYHKDFNGKVRGDNTIIDIAYKGADGNTTYVKKSLCESEVKSILPKELSRYFFFDGERIERMSKDISQEKKKSPCFWVVNYRYDDKYKCVYCTRNYFFRNCPYLLLIQSVMRADNQYKKSSDELWIFCISYC